MLFKQLFDKTSCTFTYLLADPDSKEALFIDPVDTNIDDYLSLLKTHNLQLKFSLETHVHADHITASGLLRQATGAKTGIGSPCGAESADYQIEDGSTFSLGNNLTLKAISTPGHTSGSISLICNDRIFTGIHYLSEDVGAQTFKMGLQGICMIQLPKKSLL